MSAVGEALADHLHTARVLSSEVDRQALGEALAQTAARAQGTSRPVDLDRIAESLNVMVTEVNAEVITGEGVIAVASMQIQLAIAQDTRRQADAFKEITSELHRIRRALEKR